MEYSNRPRAALAWIGWLSLALAFCLLIAASARNDDSSLGLVIAAAVFGQIAVLALVGNLVAHAFSYDSWFRSDDARPARAAAAAREAQRTPAGRSHFEEN